MSDSLYLSLTIMIIEYSYHVHVSYMCLTRRAYAAISVLSVMQILRMLLIHNYTWCIADHHVYYMRNAWLIHVYYNALIVVYRCL